MSLLSFASFSKLQGARDDDWADRISHLYTAVLLCVFTVMVSSVQYVGDPIHCWCPAEFPGEYTCYALDHCGWGVRLYCPGQLRVVQGGLVLVMVVVQLVTVMLVMVIVMVALVWCWWW